jgi:hypothetical protein
MNLRDLAIAQEYRKHAVAAGRVDDAVGVAYPLDRRNPSGRVLNCDCRERRARDLTILVRELGRELPFSEIAQLESGMSSHRAAR